MILRLSPWQCRAAAAAISVCLVVAISIAVVAPAIGAVSERWAGAQLLGKQLAALQAMIASSAVEKKQLETLRANPEFLAAFYRTAAPALASAQLQGAVAQIVQASGATLNAAQILPEADGGEGFRLSVSINVTGPIASQVKILEGLAAARPVLRVSKYALRDPDGEWANAAAAGGPNALQADLTISAYLLKE